MPSSSAESILLYEYTMLALACKTYGHISEKPGQSQCHPQAAPASRQSPLGGCHRLKHRQELMLQFHLAKQQKFQKQTAQQAGKQSPGTSPSLACSRDPLIGQHPAPQRNI